MARLLYRRAASGFRLVRGEVIRDLQLAVRDRGHDPGEIDGIFGGDTQRALEAWQEAAGVAQTGIVTDEDWSLLMGAPMPEILDRCLQVTGDFEGHGFGKVAGNFDGAWLTWGIIGFTLRHGEIEAIVLEAKARHPARLSDAFGPLESELLDVLARDAGAQEAWANSISVGVDRYRVEPAWAAAFARFGAFKEVQALQMERVGRYWDKAKRDFTRFDLKTELGIALCFDTAVQNGGIDFDSEERRIRRLFAGLPAGDQLGRRMVIADVVAENSNPRWVEDVRSRKRTIASADGTVHGARYALRDWALDDLPWSPP